MKTSAIELFRESTSETERADEIGDWFLAPDPESRGLSIGRPVESFNWKFFRGGR